jgi:hypothetical protein
MNTFFAGNRKHLLFIFSFQLLCLFAGAQVSYKGATSDLLISGTSTLHDWTMKSAKADCAATIALNAAGQINSISTLSFSTPATALKSEHTSMDNNAYTALKTDKNPTIVYSMTSVTTTPSNAGVTVTCKGRLTIAGATRDEDIVALCKTNPDGTITVTGTKSISMKQYSIDPPTFALGTVKTGNNIVLTFHLILKKA